jgi:hypothetical protein
MGEDAFRTGRIWLVWSRSSVLEGIPEVNGPVHAKVILMVDGPLGGAGTGCLVGFADVIGLASGVGDVLAGLRQRRREVAASDG